MKRDKTVRKDSIEYKYMTIEKTDIVKGVDSLLRILKYLQICHTVVTTYLRYQ